MVVTELYFTREGSKSLLPFKNEPCATNVFAKNGFSVSYCRTELLLRCRRHSGSSSDGTTWQKVILIWRRQPPKLIQ